MSAESEAGRGVISVQNRQRGVPFDLAWLRRLADVALGECLPECADGKFALRALPEVEVTVVSDRTIARVHAQFMNIPGATDVITFDHGEIVIGAGTALAHSRDYGQPLEHELALYLIHGLLHLNGYDDRTPAERTRMHRVQDRVIKSCLARLAVA